MKEKKRYEMCARDVMQKMEVEHIENNVISIFQALFSPSAASMSKGVDAPQLER